jgi:phospholipid/cholesterol/gamma-HCH transport system substrate-binding protein
MTNKDTKKFKLKVGYTVFVGLVIFFLFIIMVGTEGYYFSKTYNLNLLVKSTEGLIEGGKVSLGGLKIGQIDKIEFTTVNDQNLVKIKLALLKKYSSQITVNSFAKIETSGLLGDKLINISLGNPSERALNEGEYLPVKESLSLESLSEKIEPLVNNINGLTSNLKTITDTIKNGNGSVGKLMFGSEATKKLTSILRNLESFTQSINKEDNTIGKLAHDDELYNNLSSLTENLKTVVDSIKSGKGTLGKLVSNDSLYTNLNELTHKINKASESLNSDSTLVGGLLNDKQGYKKLSSLIDELNKLIKDIKEDPGKYINLSIF